VSSVPPPSLLHPELPDGVEPSPAVALPRRGLAAVPSWAPFLAMLATFAVAGLISVVLGALASAAGADVSADSLPPGVLIAGTLVQDLALVAFAYLFARVWVSGVMPSTFGIRRVAPRQAFRWAAVIYAAFWVFTVAYTLAIGSGPEQDLVNDLRDERSVLVLGGFAVLVGLVAPLVEELFFRGFLFGVLREKVGVPYAALVAGGVFGVVHAAGTPLRTLPILVVLGVGLCVLYQRTGSLLPGIGVHSLHNSISFGATKGLPFWAVLLLGAACVAGALAIAMTVIEREQRAGPVAAAT